MNHDGTLWLAAVNLIIWAGLFAYMLRLDTSIRNRETQLDDRNES